MEVYQPSTRPYQGLPDIDYPFHDKVVVVTNCGRICFGRKRLTSAPSSPARRSASRKGHDDIWLESFMDYDLGYFDLETNSLRSVSRGYSTNGRACLQMVPQILRSSKSSNSYFQDQSLKSLNRPAAREDLNRPTRTKNREAPAAERLYLIQTLRRVRSYQGTNHRPEPAAILSVRVVRCGRAQFRNVRLFDLDVAAIVGETRIDASHGGRFESEHRSLTVR